jgi:hypothetical protein
MILWTTWVGESRAFKTIFKKCCVWKFKFFQIDFYKRKIPFAETHLVFMIAEQAQFTIGFRKFEKRIVRTSSPLSQNLVTVFLKVRKQTI